MIGPTLPPGWQLTSRADTSNELEVDMSTSLLKQVEIQGEGLQASGLPEVHLDWRPPAPSVGCGLRNLGNSCYLNSVLQCLAYLPPLGQRCTSHLHASACPRRREGHIDCVACIVENRLSRCLHGRPGSPEAPVRLWKHLHLVSRELRRGSQEDAHEALRLLIDAMNRDSIRALKGWGYRLPPKEKEPATPVSQLFGGEVQSCVECLSCGHCSRTVDPVMDLSLDVSGSTDLESALKRFAAVDTLDGDNKYRCDGCQRLVNARKQMTLLRPPLCLVVHLKRFDALGAKLGVRVAFGESLRVPADAAPGCSAASREYELRGLVVHHGSSRTHGHYCAMVRDGAGAWYEMDDACVSRATRAAALSQPAYLLFYCRRPPPPPADLPSAAPPKRKRPLTGAEPQPRPGEEEDGPSRQPGQAPAPAHPRAYPPAAAVGASAAEAPVDQPLSKLKRLLRERCRGGPMKGLLAEARASSGPGREHLKRLMQEEARQSPWKVLGEEGYRAALAELEEILRLSQAHG